jgi:hypothetical protein
MMNQQGNVFRVLAQRRRDNSHDVNALEKFLEECAVRHQVLQVAIGGKYHPGRSG